MIIRAYFLPEIFPLNVSLLEYSVVRVDHPGPENAKQDYHHDELVDRPEHVARNVWDALFYLITRQTYTYSVDIVIRFVDRSMPRYVYLFRRLPRRCREPRPPRR